MEPARQVRDEAGRVVDYLPGRDIVFRDHIYETDDPDEVAFLRGLAGGDITEITGFDASVEPRAPEVVSMASTAALTSMRSYRCSACGRAFASPQALSLHRIRAHGDDGEAKETAEAEAQE